MTTLNLPKNVLSKEQYKALPSLQKEEYISNILREILQLNSHGVVISDIDKSTHFGHSTIWQHMMVLSTTGECLRMERGDTDVYHWNKVIAPFKGFGLKGSNLGSFYNFDIVENTYGKYLRIRRKRESRAEAHKTRQCLIMPCELIDGLIKALNKIKEKMPK